MYLKRLELHGFKSFASPTALEFGTGGTGVTCVAGPNGAGKTNVAEAIRWVLGEQASRIIRARKTEDIIFTGSAKRPALGMAEVRITLDNSDHWLPLDFEEVIVARRAYRSGENEYYINQARVRLRDVNDLFLKAQVGQNSYAFMGQGLVEQVLTLRPDERRGLIEEAADVRLHRDRLDEARHRLEATRENLERVQLLVDEIEPRLRQLERQADRATSYTRLSAELSEALHELYGRQWQEAQEALAAARAACDQRKEEFENAQRGVTAQEEALAALAEAIDEGRRDVAAREQALTALRDAVRDARHALTVDQERETMLVSRERELRAEVEGARTERERLRGVISQVEARVGELSVALEEARRPGPDADEIAALEGRIKSAEVALEAADERSAEASAALAQSEGRLAALNAQCERLRTEVGSLRESRKEPLSLLRAWAQEFRARKERAERLAPEAQRSQRVLAETKTSLDQSMANVARLRSELQTVSIELQAAETRLELTQETEADLPPPDAGVRAILVAGGKVQDEPPDPDSRLDGLLGMVGELIRVPAGLERAIESALAESLHAVVVQRQEDALAALEIVTAGDLGRAMVFPLSDVRPAHPLSLISERGVLGVASDLVRCDSRYRPLVNALLGRTIVTQNLGIAKAMLRRGLGNVVTLDGILLRQDGAMTGGSAKAIRRAMIHQRETAELPADLERLRASRGETAAGLEREERELASLQQMCDGLAPEASRFAAELVEAEQALRQHQGRLPATGARLIALRIHDRDAARSLREGTEALAVAQDELTRSRAAAAERRDTLVRARSELDALRAERERAARWEAEAASRIAPVEQEQHALQRQLEIQRPALQRTEHDLERRQETAARLAGDLSDVRERIAKAAADLEERSREEEAARSELAPARNALEQLESRQRSIGQELASGRSRAIEAERALLDAEANVHLREEELESLRGRLEEEGFRTTAEGAVVAAEAREGPPIWLAAEAATGNGELPPMRGGAQMESTALKERITVLRGQIRRLGPVNEQAGVDFAENKERYDFLSGQLTDLREAETSLLEAIEELERIIRERFSATFQRVNQEFARYFETFFNGGKGELLLTAPDERGLPGVDIVATPPRKRVRSIAMLSGGERSLTALALLFALLQTHPSPICVLDEVDAALDESNVDRFTAVLRELAQRTQFIIITHNRRTLEIADTIYGVSMGEESASTVLSLRLGDISKN